MLLALNYPRRLIKQPKPNLSITKIITILVGCLQNQSNFKNNYLRYWDWRFTKKGFKQRRKVWKSFWEPLCTQYFLLFHKLQIYRFISLNLLKNIKKCEKHRSNFVNLTIYQDKKQQQKTKTKQKIVVIKVSVSLGLARILLPDGPQWPQMISILDLVRRSIPYPSKKVFFFFNISYFLIIFYFRW